jgi:hypothetical protein
MTANISLYLWDRPYIAKKIVIINLSPIFMKTILYL